MSAIKQLAKDWGIASAVAAALIAASASLGTMIVSYKFTKDAEKSRRAFVLLTLDMKNLDELTIGY